MNDDNKWWTESVARALSTSHALPMFTWLEKRCADLGNVGSVLRAAAACVPPNKNLKTQNTLPSAPPGKPTPAAEKKHCER
jgi:hypothetical protein